MAELTRQEIRQQFQDLLERDASGAIAGYSFADLEATQPPWVDTGCSVHAGDHITVIRHGRIVVVEPDVWLDPGFQVWLRVGGKGPLIRGSRATHTFTATHDGAIQLGNAIPAEWKDHDGAIDMDPVAYEFLSGGTTVLLIHWAEGADPAAALRALSDQADPESHLVTSLETEADRIDTDPARPPEGWEHLWFLGPSETFSVAGDAIQCHTSGDAAIITKEAHLELTEDTTLTWSWKVDALPSTQAEDTLLTHDYLSIAVQFDDGLDLTYHWSAALPPETAYQCPLPHWDARETHLVIRSGTEGLGTWIDEARNVWADRARAIGGETPGRIVAVWLIAVSFPQRLGGQCTYRSIDLQNEHETLRIF